MATRTRPAQKTDSPAPTNAKIVAGSKPRTRRAAPKAPTIVTVPERDPATVAARDRAKARNVESRGRAVREGLADPKATEVVLYRLRNRETGDVYVLIDARLSPAYAAAGTPWVVRTEDGSAEQRFATRKALGKGYARPTLGPLLSAPLAPRKRVRKTPKTAAAGPAA